MQAYAYWIVLVSVAVMLTGAVSVLVLRQYMAAVVATAVVSLGASVIFVVLRAPDVALTEAAVGTGLAGVIMALSLRRLGLHRDDDPAHHREDESGER